MPGPGALRGIAKCFEDLGDHSAHEVIHWMVDHQHSEFERLGLEFRSLWGRPLHAIDCQGLFCEVDKYSRVAFPDLRSSRVRIKAKFRPKAALSTPFFPPKWGLNSTISAKPQAMGQESLFPPS
jgi:alpha-glutamyl/putrescinyl thymine pyrophosphorylase clade 1